MLSVYCSGSRVCILDSGVSVEGVSVCRLEGCHAIAAGSCDMLQA